MFASSCWLSQEQNRPSCNRGDGNCISKRCSHYVLLSCSSLRIPASDEAESHVDMHLFCFDVHEVKEMGSWEFVFTDVARIGMHSFKCFMSIWPGGTQ